MSKVTGRTVTTFLSTACKIECEYCGASFCSETTSRLQASETVIFGTFEAGLTTGSAVKGVDERIQASLKQFQEGKEVPTAKCPNCGYWQSWMLESQKDTRVSWTTILSGIAAFIVIVIIGGPFLRDVPTLATCGATLLVPVVVYFVARSYWRSADLNGGRKAQIDKLPVLGFKLSREDTRPLRAMFRRTIDPAEFASYRVLDNHMKQAQ